MTPGEILDVRGDLTERLTDETFCRIIDAAGAFDFGRSGGRPIGDEVPIAKFLSSHLKMADTYRVSADMAMLVQHAADSLDDLDRIDVDLAPTSAGFVAFDRPLPLVDQRGKTMKVNYLVWGPVHHPDATNVKSMMISSYNDAWRDPDQVQQEWAAQKNQRVTVEAGEGQMTEEHYEAFNRIMGRWATVGTNGISTGQRLGPALLVPSWSAQAHLLAEGFTPHSGSNVTRYVHALWLMMNQTIARTETEQPDRKARRRAERRKIPTGITTIRLRREASAQNREPGESMIEWTHRWVVKGHWRWQPCGSAYPGAQEVEPGVYKARLWISPFVKGPEGAPFKQTQKIYSLER